MADIFMCYAKEDRSKVERLAKTLEDAGWSVWWDRDISVAKSWFLVIEEAIESAKCVLVVWSDASVNSDWFLVEAEEGFKRSELVQVMFGKVEMPSPFSSLEVVNLGLWNGNTSDPDYKLLLQVLKSKLHNFPVKVEQHPAQEKPEVIYAPKGGYELVRIPGGEFLMGSPESEEGRLEREGPQRTVHVPDFYIGRYPVTNKEYGRFLADNAKENKPKYWEDLSYNQLRQPVVGVKWEDAQQYARWANLQLPSEAQWEYACRATTRTRYCNGDWVRDFEQVGWCNYNSDNKLRPVGEKEPNGFGLYDMHGNVWEWVEDDWHENYIDAPEDGASWINIPRCSFRVIRGGCWYGSARNCRSAYRGRLEPGYCSEFLGFRLVLLPGQ